MSLFVRRLSALFLALALLAGPVVQVVWASDMAAKMTVVAADDMSNMAMPSGCHGCGGDDQAMPTPCFAICGGGVFAIMPAAPALAMAVSVSPLGTPVVSIAGYHGPPDPYPPRSTLLS